MVLHRANKTVEYMDANDVKLEQRGFSKFCSRACLFPPRCFSDMLFDYDAFERLTERHHDELWLWTVSALNGVRVVPLDNLGYNHYDYSEEICARETGDGLGLRYNADPENIRSYNARLNDMFGKRLYDAMAEGGVEFRVHRHNAYATCMSMGFINGLYGSWNVRFLFDGDVADSWLLSVYDAAKCGSWDGDVKICGKYGEISIK